ncbi:MAG: 5'/3'-nucleotidase SurE [Burkholderiaceae bacterium]
MPTPLPHYAPPPAPIIDRVLLTNDDGIHAPGLKVLEEIARQVAREVWIVAPEHDQSGVSHAISLHAPLRAVPYGERRFGVGGTPGDSVVVALRHLMKDTPPDLVLSGVNRGGNLGVETVFSGTVGAAMTALLLGQRAIAMSQTFTDFQTIRWENARTLGAGVVRRLLAAPWPGQVCLNVNFPDRAPEDTGPMQATRQGAGRVEHIDVDARTDPRNIPYVWMRFQRGPRDNPPDSETEIVLDGGVSVTPLAFERTDQQALATLKSALNGTA